MFLFSLVSALWADVCSGNRCGINEASMTANSGFSVPDTICSLSSLIWFFFVGWEGDG